MKNMAKKGKMDVKKWDFRVYKQVIGVENISVGNQTRKAKWCKMQSFFLKTDKLEDVAGYK